jgi:hypothetical protein
MATYQREPIDGSDFNVWGPKELLQNRVAQGLNSCNLYDDSGVLKITAGKIGINTGSSTGVVDVPTAETIGIGSVSSGNWGLVLIAVGGSTATISATNITGATDPDSIPTELTGAFNGSRGAYYSGANRILGAIWKTAGGALGDIVNVDNGKEGYYGKTGNSQPVLNLLGQNFGLPIGTILPWHKSLTGSAGLPGEWVECNGQTLADTESPYNGQTIPNLNGDGSGADSPDVARKAQMFLRGGTTSGTGSEYAMEDHQHYIENPLMEYGYSRSMTDDGTSQENGIAFGTKINANIFAGEITANQGAGPAPKTDTETRPVNMTVVFIMKIK